MPDTLEIFISYSHKDEALRKELGGHLTFLSKSGNCIWHDRMIPAGSEWAGMIDDHLNSAHIILLLISADFLASHYCLDVEFQQAIRRHNAQDAVVIPIILRQVHWQWGDLARLQALPRDNKAVTSDFWNGNRDSAFLHVAEEIRKLVEELPTKLSGKMGTESQSVARGIIGSDDLYKALLRLNYKRQMELFRCFIKYEHKVGAFLIHGEPECGHVWLLHRAMRQIPESTKCKVFSFSFQRMGRGRGLAGLWGELGYWAGSKECNSAQQAVERVEGIWQTQSVALILRNISIVGEEYMGKLLQDFWVPLAVKTQQVSPQSDNCLLMFLIDDGDHADRWDIPSTNQIGRVLLPHIPVKLERLTYFPGDVIDRWIEYEMDTLLPTDVSTQNVLDNSDGGLPELVLENVCKQCGYNWYERKKVWMKY